MIFGAFALQVLRDEDSHGVIAELKAQMPNADRGEIAGMLYNILFVKEVRKRFGQ